MCLNASSGACRKVISPQHLVLDAESGIIIVATVSKTSLFEVGASSNEQRGKVVLSLVGLGSLGYWWSRVSLLTGRESETEKHRWEHL